MFNFEGVVAASDRVVDVLNGLLGLSGLLPSRFKRSRASCSAAENWRRCLGLKGTGVETREVRNCGSLLAVLSERRGWKQGGLKGRCTYRACGTQQSNQTGLYHILMNAHTPDLLM